MSRRQFMPHPAAVFGIVGLVTLIGFAAASPARQQTIKPEDAEFFETRIRPVLFENCLHCHGEEKQAGGLRMDTAAALVKGASSGVVLVAGKPEESKLIRAIQQTGAVKMPPTGKLKPNQIADIEEWVRRGAPWPEAKTQPGGKKPEVSTPMRITPEQRKFWSFQPVQKPSVPVISDPKARNLNPIDAFIIAGLQRKGLTAAPQADRRTLIRRATYDLTGLPPTPQEIDSFVNDRSPNAWEKVVDRLLASPRYGERWARHWLDVVRYCDSLDSRGIGSEGDVADAWRYRDWVIDALNSDMPYTDFIIQQVAGDIAGAPAPANQKPGSKPADDLRLANASGIIATSLLSIGNWGNGDADKDKILTDIADDQVDVVSRGFMGLTMACARCHNHKFDPLSTQDYYSLAGIFFSTHILPKLTPKGAGETPMKVALFKPELVAARSKYAADLAAKEQNYNAAMDEARRTVAASLLADTQTYMTAAWEYRLAGSKPNLDEFAAKQGLRSYALRQWLDYQGPSDYVLMTTPLRDVLGSKGVYGFRGAGDTPSITANTNKEARQILTFTLLPRSVAIHPGPASGVAVLWSSPISGTVQIGGRVADADPAGGDGIAWEIGLRSSAGARVLAGGGFENGGMQPFDAVGATGLKSVQVKPGDRIELHVLPKTSHTCDTTTVELQISEVGGKRTWDLTKDVLDNLNEGGNPHPDSLGNSAVWRFVDMAGKAGTSFDPATFIAFTRWRELISTPKETDRNAVGNIAAEFSAKFKTADSSSPFWPPAKEAESSITPESRTLVAKLSAELSTLRSNPPPPLEYANGAQEGGVPESPHAGVHDVKIHIRGRYDRLAELAPRGFPKIIAGDNHPWITSGSGRLELAKWLASDKHPLTARVMVNRIWQHHFGEGIVRTPSNFGFLGERPTNPELLDWLASSFSSTDTRSNPYACGWSVKKMHRLVMLSATYQQSSMASPLALKVDPDNRLLGRMNRRRLEAEEIRDSLLTAAARLDTTMGGMAIRDFKTPRRSVYIMTVRSDRTGFGPLFDMADSTSQVDKRTVSTVAPQALFLLNDPFALDQAKGIARRLLNEAAADDSVRIQKAYLFLYGRQPSADELRIGAGFLAQARRQPTARVAGPGAPNVEEAAWTAYAQILFSANEFMYVD